MNSKFIFKDSVEKLTRRSITLWAKIFILSTFAASQWSLELGSQDTEDDGAVLVVICKWFRVY